MDTNGAYVQVSIPADEDKLIEMIVARDDYKNRADREAE